MRNTPETDAKASPHIGFYSCATVSAAFARKLERERDEAITRRMETIMQCELYKQERDEAREELRTAVQERHDFHWELQDAIRERNEAREALKHIEEYGMEEINAAVELRQKLASALLERDEAREQVDFLREKHDLTPMCWNV